MDKVSIYEQYPDMFSEVDLPHIQILHTNYPIEYKHLSDILNLTKMTTSFNITLPKFLDIQSLFPKCITKTKVCANQLKKYFYCRDCFLSKEAALCQACFDLKLHQNHNYAIVKGNDIYYCSCGLKNMIKQHIMCQYHCCSNQPDQKLTEVQKIKFKSFFIILLRILLNPRFLNFLKLLQNAFKYLLILNKNSIQYNRLTCQVLAEQVLPKSKSILMKYLQICQKHYYNPQCNSIQLFHILYNIPQFQYILTQAFFMQVTSTQVIYKHLIKLCNNTQIINKLCTKNIIGLNKKQQPNNKQIISLYLQIRKQYEDSKKFGVFVPVWKYLFENTEYINSCIKEINYHFYQYSTFQDCFIAIIITDSITDLPFVKKLVAQLVQLWSAPGIYKYKTICYKFNYIIRAILTAVKGDIYQIGTMFQQCNMNKLKIFIDDYFSETFCQYFKPKFNSLTASCLLMIAKCHNIKIYIPQLPCLKLARLLGIIIRNMTTFDHYTNNQIYKIAKLTDNYQLAQDKWNKIVKWFAQYCFMKRIIPHTLINSLRDQHITHIPKIKLFITQYLRYNKPNKHFQYIGPDMQTNPKLLLDLLVKKQQIYGLAWDDQNNQYYSPQKAQILLPLTQSLVQKAKCDQYPSHNKIQRYMICVTAVVLSKITNGQNINKYVLKLRDVSKYYRNTSVEKLFRLNKYQIKKQQIVKIQVKSQDILKQCQQTKIITKQKQKLQLKQEIITQKQIKSSEKAQEKPKVQKKQVDIRKQAKRSKILQKFNKKALNMIKKHNIEQGQSQKDVCLICRQPTNNYSFLYYFTTFKRKNSNLIQKILRTQTKNKLQLSLQTCFHTVHKTCNQNRTSCILCKKQFNFFIPVIQTQDKDQRLLFVSLWWNDEFMPAYQKLLGIKNIKSQQLEKYMFTSLFGSFISQMGLLNFLLLKKGRKTEHKLKILLQFLNQVYKLLPQIAMIKFDQQLNQRNKILQESNNFLDRVQLILNKLTLYKLQNNLQQVDQQYRKIILFEMQIIKNYKEFKYSQQIITFIEWILGCKINTNNYQFVNSIDNIFEIWQQLKIFCNVPSNVKQLKQYAKMCKKCCEIQTYFCIVCNMIICPCENKPTHHFSTNKYCIYIALSDGCAYFLIGNNIQKAPIYYNFLMNDYNSQKRNIQQYTINKQALYQVVLKTMQ